MKHLPIIVQYVCAVLLIITSIVMAFYQVVTIRDVEGGVLMYIAQAFLLAGSIFGLDYYVNKFRYLYNETKRNQAKQSAEHPAQS